MLAAALGNAHTGWTVSPSWRSPGPALFPAHFHGLFPQRQAFPAARHVSQERTLLSLMSSFPRLSCPARRCCLQRWTDFKWHSPSGAGRVDLRADVGPDLTPGRIPAWEAISEPWSLRPAVIAPMNSYPGQKPRKLVLSLAEFWVCIFERVYTKHDSQESSS